MTPAVSGLARESFNHGCSEMPMDPHLETTQRYDFKYIEHTVYRLARTDGSLGRNIKVALEVIEKAYRDYG